MDRQKRKTILIPSLAVVCFVLTAVQFFHLIPRGLYSVAFYILELVLGCWALLCMRGWRVSIWVKIGLVSLLLPAIAWSLWWFGFMYWFFFVFRF